MAKAVPDAELLTATHDLAIRLGNGPTGAYGLGSCAGARATDVTLRTLAETRPTHSTQGSPTAVT